MVSVGGVFGLVSVSGAAPEVEGRLTISMPLGRGCPATRGGGSGAWGRVRFLTGDSGSSGSTRLVVRPCFVACLDWYLLSLCSNSWLVWALLAARSLNA